jgi:hypothetical protein
VIPFRQLLHIAKVGVRRELPACERVDSVYGKVAPTKIRLDNCKAKKLLSETPEIELNFQTSNIFVVPN